MQSIAMEGGKEQDEKLRNMIEEMGEIITGMWACVVIHAALRSALIPAPCCR